MDGDIHFTIKQRVKSSIFFLRYLFFLLLVPVFLVPRAALYCQQVGFKYIKNYNSGMHPLNWSIIQDKRGIIYIANNACVLEFDGVSMRKINIPNWWVRSLAIDHNGTVYVGGVNELGFLASDSHGMMRYVSLIDHVTDHRKNFSTVWRINPTRQGVYFRTTKFMFRWDAKAQKMDAWESRENFNASFTCNGKLFVHQRRVGLMEMVNDSLKMIRGNETLASVKIYMIAPYTANSTSVLIGTRSTGFYIYDGKKAKAFPTGVDGYLRENQLYHGIRLSFSDGTADEFALATLRGGLVIMDSRGELKRIFNKTSGLQDDNVKCVYEDFQGNLWLALENGVSRIEYASPISIYNDRLSDLPSSVLSIALHRGTGSHGGDGDDGAHGALYVGTSRGLYVQSFPGDRGSPGQFRAVPGITGKCWALLPVDDSLLAAASSGVSQVQTRNLTHREVINTASYVLLPSTAEPGRVLVGTRTGLVSLRLENHRWAEAFHFETINQPIRSIVEDKKGNLWLGTLASGVLKVNFPEEGKIRHPIVTRYNESHGLPGGEVRIFQAAGHVIFAANKKIYRFNEKKRNFTPDITLGKTFVEGSQSIFSLVEDRKKNIWFHSEFKNYHAAVQPDGTFVINAVPFLRIPDSQVNVIYPDPSGHAVWFGGHNGLVYYYAREEKNYRLDFSTIIRDVVINGIPMIYDDYREVYKASRTWNKLLVIPYKDRNLRFRFASPFFEDETSTMYRCLLEGYDQEWTGWGAESQKDYTNLDSGLYTFRVQGRNVYGHKGREAVFRFKILPPWYKTWWAFSVYILTAFLVVFLVVKWRSGTLEREKKRLERIVERRTKEINTKNRQLENQNLQLKEQSSQLQEMNRIKSRFFANISHEFRTPLTLIMGPLEQMLTASRGKKEDEKVGMILRNARRLLYLINQLLDLSRFDSGKMKLAARPQNMVAFLKGIVDAFNLLALQQQLDLVFHPAAGNITLYIDPPKMEDLMSNLLVNAIKFTPPGGKITVRVKVAKQGTRLTGRKEEELVEILVSDTGIGIPRDQLVHIFDRFYQAGSSSADRRPVPGERDFQGTGIGLAVTRELVHLHHGTIDVRSSVGENSGTEFIIRLPMGKQHLEPDEISTSPGDIADNTGTGDTSQIKASPGVAALYTVDNEDQDGQTNRAQGKDTADIRDNDEEEAWEAGKEIILVVEDNADTRKFIRGTLEPVYSVKEAPDGKQGIHKAKTIIPDLVISDVMMPGMDGYELCNLLKEDIKTSHIPVILLTARAAEENILQGFETGADDYITKPFNTKILLARIRNLIDIRRQWQQRIQREMTLQPADIPVSSMDKKFMNETQQMIEKNLSDQFFNVDQLGKKLYMSRATLYRKIHALTGQSPREFIKSYRLKRGAQMLKANFGNVTEVACEVGFSSTAYFTKCFKEKFLQLPSDYQNVHREK